MKIFNSSEQLFYKVADLLTFILQKTNAETKVIWSSYDTAQDFIDDLNKKIELLKIKDYAVLSALHLQFLPTGDFQEISISNGWGDEFLQLASQFDDLYYSLNCRFWK